MRNNKMKKIYVVGNWKCNPAEPKKALKLFSSISARIRKMKLGRVKVVVCPPFVYLSEFQGKGGKIKLGAQNCLWEKEGAFTGEVSPTMIKKLGCRYVIIGHSERRKYFGEKGAIIRKKIRLALNSGLKPILCIDSIAQIKPALTGLSMREKKEVIVAYEPIWAIGTGKTPTYEQAARFNAAMKKKLGASHPTLYGGSVKADNAVGFIEISGFHGLLIGGASLKPQEFSKIAKLVSAL
jgi:triosephosphate isomerase